jgi:hypothetical protein
MKFDTITMSSILCFEEKFDVQAVGLPGRWKLTQNYVEKMDKGVG